MFKILDEIRAKSNFRITNELYEMINDKLIKDEYTISKVLMMVDSKFNIRKGLERHFDTYSNDLVELYDCYKKNYDFYYGFLDCLHKREEDNFYTYSIQYVEELANKLVSDVEYHNNSILYVLINRLFHDGVLNRFIINNRLTIQKYIKKGFIFCKVTDEKCDDATYYELISITPFDMYVLLPLGKKQKSVKSPDYVSTRYCVDNDVKTIEVADNVLLKEFDLSNYCYRMTRIDYKKFINELDNQITYFADKLSSPIKGNEIDFYNGLKPKPKTIYEYQYNLIVFHYRIYHTIMELFKYNPKTQYYELDKDDIEDWLEIYDIDSNLTIYNLMDRLFNNVVKYSLDYAFFGNTSSKLKAVMDCSFIKE